MTFKEMYRKNNKTLTAKWLFSLVVCTIISIWVVFGDGDGGTEKHGWGIVILSMFVITIIWSFLMTAALWILHFPEMIFVEEAKKYKQRKEQRNIINTVKNDTSRN